LVTAAELNDLLGEEGVVILDVRKSGYDEGHIPRAVSVTTAEFYEEREGVKKMAAGPEKMSAFLSRIGVTRESRIIIYADAKGLKYATRLWWVLKLYGHENAQVLDGGIEAWTAAGYELSTEPVTPEPSTYTVTAADVRQDAVATTAEVKAALKTDTVIVDCRSLDYFRGKKAKAARSGHIKGAVLVSYDDLLNADGTFKSEEELAEVFGVKGVTNYTPVITTCNTGTTATTHYLALTRILGYTNVQNHDASLMGWAQDPTLPMESDYDFFTIGSKEAEINAVLLELEAAPCIQDGRAFAPASALAFGLEAYFAQAGDVIRLVANGRTLEMQVGSPVLKVDGISLPMGAAPFESGGVTFLPVRAVAEAVGAEVEWNAEKRQISLAL